jgi:predicted secreted protein
MSHSIANPRRLLSAVAVILALACGPAFAQNNFDLSLLNPGEIMVNLNATEQLEVEQDTLHAGLVYTTRGRDQVVVQDQVNQVMAGVQALLEDSDVESSIQRYYVHNVQPSRPTRGDIDNPLWQGRQGVQLSSQDSASLLALVGELQELGLTMSGLHYSLSPRRQEEVADSLMETALDKLRNRAAATADAMGKRDVEIVEITMNSSGGGGYYRSMSTAMAMESSMDVATPVAEPGMTTVSFNVSARAILLP